MRLLLAGLMSCVLTAVPAAAADFASSYAVKGSSPDGGGDYSGTVAIKRTGDATYQVVWTIGKDKFVGTGIGSTDGLAVAYRSGANTGIAIYRDGGAGMIEGFWTYAGGVAIGKENWTAK